MEAGALKDYATLKNLNFRSLTLVVFPVKNDQPTKNSL